MAYIARRPYTNIMLQRARACIKRDELPVCRLPASRDDLFTNTHKTHERNERSSYERVFTCVSCVHLCLCNIAPQHSRAYRIWNDACAF